MLSWQIRTFVRSHCYFRIARPRAASKIWHHARQQIVSECELMQQCCRCVQHDKPKANFCQENVKRRKTSRQIHRARSRHGQSQNAHIQAKVRRMREPTLPGARPWWQTRRAMEQAQREQNHRQQQYRPAGHGMNLVKKHIERRRLQSKIDSMRSLNCGRRRNLKDAKTEYQPVGRFLHK